MNYGPRDGNNGPPIEPIEEWGEWTPWYGGPCPFLEYMPVNCRMRGGPDECWHEGVLVARNWIWKWTPGSCNPLDTVAYRLPKWTVFVQPRECDDVIGMIVEAKSNDCQPE